MVARTGVPCVGSLAVLKLVFGFFSGFEETPAGVCESAVRFDEDIAEVDGWKWADVDVGGRGGFGVRLEGLPNIAITRISR